MERQRRPTRSGFLRAAALSLMTAVLSLGMLAAMPDYFVREPSSRASGRHASVRGGSGGMNGMGDKLWGAAGGGGQFVQARRSFDDPAANRRKLHTKSIIPLYPLKLLLGVVAIASLAWMSYRLGQWVMSQMAVPQPADELPTLRF